MDISDGNISICSNDVNDVNQPNNDKITAASHLPTVATYNMRSLFPKLGNVTTERGISVGFFSEIWEKSRK